MPNNALGQPVGEPVEDFAGASPPVHEAMAGRRCRLEPLEVERHAEALHAAYAEDRDGGNWTYLPYGPCASAEEYRSLVVGLLSLEDAQFYAILDEARETPVGVAAYLRIFPAIGSIEVGHLSYAPALQRTPISTEAMYLMMRRVFEDWGYRRYEWKCDSLNAPSRAAAQRLGFRYEGLFRNNLVVKGRNRDTAWFSITRDEWPGLRQAFETWLAPENFDEAGRQRTRLGALMPAMAGRPIVLDAADPA